jgi:hypothetical protein
VRQRCQVLKSCHKADIARIRPAINDYQAENAPEINPPTADRRTAPLPRPIGQS